VFLCKGDDNDATFNYLGRHGGRVFATVCLFVCFLISLSVSGTNQKVTDEFSLKFLERQGLGTRMLLP